MTAPLAVRCVVPGVELHSLNDCMREHPKARWRRQKALCGRLAPFVSRGLRGVDLGGPLVVTLVRVAPRAYDSDNWSGGDAKAVRDWLAREYLRRDDKDSAALAWRYEQRRGAVREYAVVIELRGTT